MCLVSEKINPNITQTNIECYKILIPIGSKLYTPYRDFIFEINKLYEDKAEENIKEIFNEMIMIESGFFHSYLNKEIARNQIKHIDRKIKYKAKLFKAIIPKDTKYYKGQFEDICSKSLKIIEECFD